MDFRLHPTEDVPDTHHNLYEPHEESNENSQDFVQKTIDMIL